MAYLKDILPYGIRVNSPYIVTDTVQVLKDIKLTVEPGVEVKFNENTGLNIGGELNAVGTESEMITFTSNQDVPQSQDWIGIKFTDDSVDAQIDSQNNYLSGSVIKYCVVEYGGGSSNGIYFVGAIELNRASPYISNNIIRHNFSYDAGGGMFVYLASPIITLNTFSDNVANNQGGAIFFERSSSITSYNTIINNVVVGTSGKGGGIHIQGQYSQDIVKITFNLIKNNTAANGNAVSLKPYNTSSFISQADINYNNIVNSNSGYEIYTFNNTDIDATNNYWDTTNTSIIDAKIYDYYDDISLGKVNYEPYALAELKLDGTDTFSQPSTCTSFIYSDWSACQFDGTKSRTIISSSPSSCSGGNPVLTQTCEYTLPICTSWTYSNWSECVDGQQTRTISSSSPSNCINDNPVLSQSCQNETDNEDDAKIITQPETSESNPEETSTTISDGDIIQCQNSSNPSAVYIVKIVGDTKYIRHIVSLDIFNYYKHLKWGNLKQVDSLDDYSLSGWVRYNTGLNGAAGPTDKVYEINGDQTRHWINMTAEDFLTHGGSEPAIFNINQGELNLYIAGVNVMSL